MSIDLKQALQEGKNEICEFRQSFGDDSLRTLCAFANRHGGTLWIGVNDDGSIAGVALGKETIRDWANQIRRSLGLNAQIESFTIENKTIVRITINESQFKPVRYRGRIWRRVGSTDQRATDEEETRWVLERVGTTWDVLPDPRARLDHLNPEQILPASAFGVTNAGVE
jgi:ATP-dependent DNA helicase RecG